MPVFIDDQQTPIQGPGLAAVLEAARDQAATSGRIVVEVQINGATLAPEQIERLADQPVAGSEVKLYTAEPVELACQAVEQARQALARARQCQSEAAELFQSDKPEQAMPLVGEALDIWQQSHQAVGQAAALIGFDLDAAEFDGTAWAEAVADFIQRLGEVKELLQSGDTVALADVLAYEWPGLTERWDAVLADLIERFANHAT